MRVLYDIYLSRRWLFFLGRGGGYKKKKTTQICLLGIGQGNDYVLPACPDAGTRICRRSKLLGGHNPPIAKRQFGQPKNMGIKGRASFYISIRGGGAIFMCRVRVTILYSLPLLAGRFGVRYTYNIGCMDPVRGDQEGEVHAHVGRWCEYWSRMSWVMLFLSYTAKSLCI